MNAEQRLERLQGERRLEDDQGGHGLEQAGGADQQDRVPKPSFSGSFSKSQAVEMSALQPGKGVAVQTPHPIRADGEPVGKLGVLTWRKIY